MRSGEGGRPPGGKPTRCGLHVTGYGLLDAGSWFLDFQRKLSLFYPASSIKHPASNMTFHVSLVTDHCLPGVALAKTGSLDTVVFSN